MKTLRPIVALVWLSACISNEPMHEVAAVSGELSAPEATQDPSEASTQDTVALAVGATPELSAWQLRESLSRSSAGLKSEKRPDGTSQVLLRGRFSSMSVVSRDETGKRQQTCIDSPEAAERIFGVKQ
jgi:hypothetical protein